MCFLVCMCSSDSDESKNSEKKRRENECPRKNFRDDDWIYRGNPYSSGNPGHNLGCGAGEDVFGGRDDD